MAEKTKLVIIGIVFTLLAGVIAIRAFVPDTNSIIDWVGGSLVTWGGTIVFFYFRKKGPG